MRGFITYSRPRGKYGRIIFTVVIYFSETTEKAGIQVVRDKITYSCNHCGRWASMNISETLPHTEYQKKGILELYRYDGVEPGDRIEFRLSDPELVVSQKTVLQVDFFEHTLKSYWYSLNTEKEEEKLLVEMEDNLKGHWMALYAGVKEKYDALQQSMREMSDEFLYEILLLDWDAYSKPMNLSVEEDLIQKTMNAEPITIKELVLEPAGQPLAIEGEKWFIEGTLKRLP